MTTRRPNRVELLADGSARLWITNRDRGEIASALVDQADLPRITAHRWSINSRGYVQTRLGPNVNVKLHHFLCGAVTKGLVVDHYNGNKLDNRRSNLRIVTHKQNSQNTNWKSPTAEWTASDGWVMPSSPVFIVALDSTNYAAQFKVNGRLTLHSGQTSARVMSEVSTISKDLADDATSAKHLMRVRISRKLFRQLNKVATEQSQYGGTITMSDVVRNACASLLAGKD